MSAPARSLGVITPVPRELRAPEHERRRCWSPVPQVSSGRLRRGVGGAEAPRRAVQLPAKMPLRSTAGRRSPVSSRGIRRPATLRRPDHAQGRYCRCGARAGLPRGLGDSAYALCAGANERAAGARVERVRGAPVRRRLPMTVTTTSARTSFASPRESRRRSPVKRRVPSSSRFARGSRMRRKP